MLLKTIWTSLSKTKGCFSMIGILLVFHSCTTFRTIIFFLRFYNIIVFLKIIIKGFRMKENRNFTEVFGLYDYRILISEKWIQLLSCKCF